MPSVATWMDLEIIIPSKLDRERQMSQDIAYMFNLTYTYMWYTHTHTQTFFQIRKRLTDIESKLTVKKQVRGKVGSKRDKLGGWD